MSGETYLRAGGRPGRVDPRGNSTSRKRRKEKLLSDPSFARRPGTEGTHVNCVHCGKELDTNTVEQDRKEPGGPYAYHNIQPACSGCNKRRSNNPDWKAE